MRPANRRGFTVLEVVVALALLSVVLLIAGRLLVASRRMEASVARVAAGPRLAVLGVRLRHDIERAVGVPLTGGAWSSRALRLELGDGTRVAYDLDGGALSRRVVSPGGSARDRVVIRGLTAFRWRSVTGDAVDVRIRFAMSGLGERGGARGVDAVWWLRVAPRGAGGLRRW